VDPAGWGSDHVGKPLPEFVSGDECLFCHRNDIGPNWDDSRHNRTVRDVEPDSPALAKLPEFKDQVQLVLGRSRLQRFLKRSEAYGKLDVLSVAWNPAEAKMVNPEKPHWDTKFFAAGCAGCHATAVDPKTQAFTALALDCYACHGVVDLKHSKNPALAPLAKKRKDPARVVTSICAQCHVRTGKSASTGLPYPNNFVAGDNLFRDFKVDLSPEAISKLNPADRHVLENVRDVVVLGKEEVTCLTCHDVHKQSSKKHHKLADDASCTTCHNPTGSKKVRPAYEVHSHTCGY
jgi:hypothetical protein